MDIVLGVSMEPTTVRLVLIEGDNADGVTVEEDIFQVVAAGGSGTSGAVVEQVIASIIGTREGAVQGGCQLTSTGVTWTDPAEVTVLRDELAAHDIRGVMLVSPLLAAAALAQTVGISIGYEHIAMLFVEPRNVTLAVVDVADGSIVDLHRQPLDDDRQIGSRGTVAARLAMMVAGLDARGSRADGVFLIGCGTDIVSLKPALEAATALPVSAPEEPDMALARGAALASANAPLFASSTAALAYALDPGTGEVNGRTFSPTYLDVAANADLGEGVLAYSALDDEADDDRLPRRRPLVLAGSALASGFAIAAAVVVLSLTSDRPASTPQHSPGGAVATPVTQLPAQLPAPPAPAQLPAPSSAQAAPPTAVAAPSAPPTVEQAPPITASRAPTAPATHAYRAPASRAPASVPTPQEQVAPAPAAPAPSPPAAAPAPAPEPASPAVPARPPMTMYLHLPFVTIPIPITPPPPPAPPPGP